MKISHMASALTDKVATAPAVILVQGPSAGTSPAGQVWQDEELARAMQVSGNIGRLPEHLLVGALVPQPLCQKVVLQMNGCWLDRPNLMLRRAEQAALPGYTMIQEMLSRLRHRFLQILSGTM
jgi:hypothetical protein